MEPTKKELEAIEAEPRKVKGLTSKGVKVLRDALADRDYLYMALLTWSDQEIYHKAVEVLGQDEVDLLLLLN